MSLSPFVALAETRTRNPAQTLLASTQTTLTADEFVDVAERLAALISNALANQSDSIALSLKPELFSLVTFACYHLGLASFKFRPDTTLLRSLNPQVVITDDASLDVGSLKKLILNQQTMASLAEMTKENPRVIQDTNLVANYFFSSGTTGIPKIIPVTFAQLSERESFVRQARIRGRYMSLLGLGTFGGFMTMYSQIINGQTYFVPGNAEANLNLIANWGLDTIFASPAQLSEVLSSLEKGSKSITLKEVQATGTLIPGTLVEQIMRSTGAKITNAYASTEAGVVVMKTDSWDDPSYCGEILDGVSLEISDPEGVAVSDGISGEIRLQAPGQAQSYLDNPQESQKQFRDGWFYPGDLGIKRGQSLFLIGRSSEIINAGGVKISPDAIDEFAREYSGIEDAAVFTFTNDNGVSVTAMAFVCKVPPNPEIFQRYLKSKFGEAAPMHLYRVAGIPRNELGKPMRGLLGTRFLEARAK